MAVLLGDDMELVPGGRAYDASEYLQRHCPLRQGDMPEVIHAFKILSWIEGAEGRRRPGTVTVVSPFPRNHRFSWTVVAGVYHEHINARAITQPSAERDRA